MHRYTQANNLVRYTRMSSSLMSAQNLFTTDSITIHPLEVPSVEMPSPRSQTGSNINSTTPGNENERLRVFTPRGNVPTPVLEMLCESFPTEEEPVNRVVYNTASKSSPSKNSKGKKMGQSDSKEISKTNEKEKNKKKSKTDEKENKKMVPSENPEIRALLLHNYPGRSDEDNLVCKNSQGKKMGKSNSKEISKTDEKEKNKKKSKADEKENKKMVPSENPEIRALLLHNYPGRSDEDNLVCYVCDDAFNEPVHLKNHIVNLHLRHIPIQEFAVCPGCGLVCRSRSQFVEHALKSRNACRSLVKRKEKPAPRRKEKKMKNSIDT